MVGAGALVVRALISVDARLRLHADAAHRRSGLQVVAPQSANIGPDGILSAVEGPQ